jgi:carbamoyltransferase
MTMNILGISAYYHDSAAALISGGDIVAAAQEERFSRKKHDSRFPVNAVQYCLDEAGLTLSDIDAVAFYDKPWIKFERLLESYLASAPKGFLSFISSMPVWIKEKLFLKTTIRDELAKLGQVKKKNVPAILFAEHHQSHAASAFYPSPFEKSAVLCMDGVGEWATTSAWLGEGNRLTALWQIDFPHSLGMLYSAFTYYTGFKVNSGEYKLMGLAPYGNPVYVDKIFNHLVDVKSDGTFRLAQKYFNYVTGLTMTSPAFHQLFGGGPRKPESPVTQKEMDLARSIQAVTEEIILKIAKSLQAETGVDELCLAGGVALNCVANGRLLREGPFKKLWIQPASNDAGGALGCALSAWYQYFENPRPLNPTLADAMKGSYLGPQFSNEKVRVGLDSLGAKYRRLDETELLGEVAEILAGGSVVGWFQGRMEFGPRALGSRSIIGDARNSKMQSVMNLKIKFRESFRPFAPVVLAEDVGTYFDMDRESPYMLIVAPVKESLRKKISVADENLFGIDKLNVARSEIPAVTHVDYSARIQTVHEKTNPRLHHLIKEFKTLTDCSVLVNTSFNVRGEPIVCSPEDAYRCFMRTEMDYLIVEDFILAKSEQPHWHEKERWQEEFQLD